MQSLTRNNHITSNRLSSLALIPSKHISAITFFINPPFHAHLQPHSCTTLHQDARFAGALRCLRTSSTHPHFSFAQKIGRVTKSATLPYTFHFYISKLYLLAIRTRSIPRSKELGQFYTSEVFKSLLRFGRCKTDIHRMSCTLICGMVPPHLSYTPYIPAPTKPPS